MNAADAGRRAEIGVIGGSGLYALDTLTYTERIEVATPYGPPSSPIVPGTLHGRRVAFLARHGEGHTLLPAEIPARANIHACKQFGVERMFASSAIGSLQQNTEHARATLAATIATLGDARDCGCGCGDALGSALVTTRELVPTATQRRLASLLARYWEPVNEAATPAGGDGA